MISIFMMIEIFFKINPLYNEVVNLNYDFEKKIVFEYSTLYNELLMKLFCFMISDDTMSQILNY